jgi:hypothetical protein
MVMRMLMQISVPVEKGNAAIRDGRIETVMLGFRERWQPEAMYFTALNGERTVVAVVDLARESDIPPMLEPFFLELEAKVEFAPAMNGDDLGAGLAAMGQ